MENAHSGLENLNLTSDEVDKFQTAFKDETFKKMFAEYAKEISDPKNKAESDAYLKQLEMEGKIEQVYGKDVQLIMPKPGFVAKTFQEEQEVSKEGDEGSDRGSETEKQPPKKGRKHKAFINVCHSEKVADATSEKRPGGLQWSVPHTLGQPHDEVDKQGEVCVAYDFCVSERTFQLTQTDERLQTMVVETAIEAVNKAFGKTYQMDFTLPKKTFMGPKTGPGVQALKGEKGGGGGVRVQGLKAVSLLLPSSLKVPPPKAGSGSTKRSAGRKNKSNPKKKRRPRKTQTAKPPPNTQ
jgi:dynein assembly factor 2, axonemal